MKKNTLHKLLKPQALKSHDKALILPLASVVKKNIFDEGIKYTDKYAIRTKTTINPVFSGYKFLFSAASALTRAKEFQKAFQADDIQALFSLRGGYGSAEILPHINFAACRKKPKIFVGFSDTTALLTSLYQFAGITCIHGAPFISYGYKASQGDADAEKSLDCLYELLCGRIINPFENIKLDPIIKSAKTVNGRLTGGNLSVLASLAGTKWQAVFDNHIVFLEDTGEPPYKVHRMLTQLKQSGMFRKVKGLVLGDFIDNRKNTDPGEPGFEDVIRDIFKEKAFPVYRGLPVGHGSLNYPVPIGVRAKLGQNRLEIPEQAVIL